jgi:RND family efflux transporter MFP subunit
MHPYRLLLIAGAILCLTRMATGPVWGQAPAPRVLAEATIEKEVRQAASFVGTVKPLRRSTVGSAVDGRVDAFPVNEGDFVEEGKPLAELKTETFKIQLAAAQAELKLRTIERDELKKLRPDEVNEAQARMDGAKALQDFTRLQRERMQALANRGSVTLEQYQESVSAADRANQAFLEAKAAHAVVSGSEKVAKAEARVTAQEEEIRRLEDIIKKHVIVAPFSGFVVAEHVELGRWVKSGDPVVEMVDIESVEVEVLVPQDYITKVQAKDNAGVQIDGLEGPPLTGTIERIVPSADMRARTFPVKVLLTNPKHVLKAGMLANVTLGVGAPTKSVLVPKDALVLGGRRYEVFVVEGKGDEGKGGDVQAKVRAVPVQLGVSDGAWVAVTAQPALKPGQLVIVQGNERLVDGAMVTLTKVEAKKDKSE